MVASNQDNSRDDGCVIGLLIISLTVIIGWELVMTLRWQSIYCHEQGSLSRLSKIEKVARKVIWILFFFLKHTQINLKCSKTLYNFF